MAVAKACACTAFALLLIVQIATAARQLSQEAPTDTLVCDVAIVGGEPGGVYSGYRLLESEVSSNLCLFEMNNRVGGRVYSVRGLGPNEDLVLDMGAYRYMPLSQPLITDLIENLLQLPNRLYQPGVPDYKVVLNPDGSNAGFSLYVEKLFEMAQEMGLKATFSTKIMSVDQSESGGFTLTTDGDTTISANKVVLNLATRPLKRLLQNSNLPNATEFSPHLDHPYINRATKLYLYYEPAWWLQGGLNNGSLQFVNRNWPPVEVPIIGRYHDAQVRCPLMDGNGVADYYYEDSSLLDTQNCYGYIQAIYTSDAGTTNYSHIPLDYMVDYQSSSDPNVPYSILDDSTPRGAKLLTDAHNQLMKYHANASILLPPGTQTNYPSQAVVALWDQAVSWVGGGWSVFKDEEEYNTAPNYLDGIKPYDNLEMYVANEAYSSQQGWSEGSLVLVENFLQAHFGAGIPTWFRQSTWPQVNLAAPTFNDYEVVPQGITIVPVENDDTNVTTSST